LRRFVRAGGVLDAGRLRQAAGTLKKAKSPDEESRKART
jgi:hypothetical protein